MDINFVVSNNHTEFKFLNDIAIMLSYFHILAVCVFHKKITEAKATEIYNCINLTKTHRSSHTFSQKLDESMKYFKNNMWLEQLRLNHL